MTKQEITVKTIQILENITESHIDLDSSRENTTAWDSLNHVRLLLELNESFSIKIPFDFFGKLNSIDEIVNFIMTAKTSSNSF